MEVIRTETNLYDAIMMLMLMVALITMFFMYLNYAKTEEGRKVINLREKYKTERFKARYDYRLRKRALKNEAKYIAKDKVDDYDVSDMRAEVSE